MRIGLNRSCLLIAIVLSMICIICDCTLAQESKKKCDLNKIFENASIKEDSSRQGKKSYTLEIFKKQTVNNEEPITTQTCVINNDILSCNSNNSKQLRYFKEKCSNNECLGIIAVFDGTETNGISKWNKLVDNCILKEDDEEITCRFDQFMQTDLNNVKQVAVFFESDILHEIATNLCGGVPDPKTQVRININEFNSAIHNKVTFKEFVQGKRYVKDWNFKISSIDKNISKDDALSVHYSYMSKHENRHYGKEKAKDDQDDKVFRIKRKMYKFNAKLSTIRKNQTDSLIYEYASAFQRYSTNEHSKSLTKNQSYKRFIGIEATRDLEYIDYKFGIIKSTEFNKQRLFGDMSKRFSSPTLGVGFQVLNAQGKLFDELDKKTLWQTMGTIEWKYSLSNNLKFTLNAEGRYILNSDNVSSATTRWQRQVSYTLDVWDNEDNKTGWAPFVKYTVGGEPPRFKCEKEVLIGIDWKKALQ